MLPFCVPPEFFAKFATPKRSYDNEKLFLQLSPYKFLKVALCANCIYCNVWFLVIATNALLFFCYFHESIFSLTIETFSSDINAQFRLPELCLMPSSSNHILPPQVLETLHSDSIIIFPTETLYGIGCSIWHEDAIARVFEIKGRAPDQAPPILIAEVNQLNGLIENMPQSASVLIERFWPGSLTLVFAARAELPSSLCSFNEKQNVRTIAIRQTAHPIAAAVCGALASPVVATSANFSGETGRAGQPQTVDDIPRAFQNLADVVINGAAVGGAPSTIVDCLSDPPRVLRAGAISLMALQNYLPEIQAL